MTINVETPEQPNVKEITEQELLGGPQILMPEGISLPATHRCDFCGVQAWVEVEIPYKRTTLHLNTEAKVGSGENLLSAQVTDQHAKEIVLLCAHDYGTHEDKIKNFASKIVDYRPTLVKQEKMGGPAL